MCLQNRSRRKKVRSMNEHRFGKCPWCERERSLTFVLGYIANEGRVWCDYVCYECLEAAKKIAEGKCDG
jgi:hypothetical protein